MVVILKDSIIYLYYGWSVNAVSNNMILTTLDYFALILFNSPSLSTFGCILSLHYVVVAFILMQVMQS